jgi:protein gp37
MSTNISWTDETWNSIVGCSRISAGCINCYAAIAAASPRLQQFPQYQKVKDWDGTVEFVESQLLKPLSWKKPKRIFVCSMSDLFHENIPDEWRDRIFAVMAVAHWHTFQVLTKRPENALRYFQRNDLAQAIKDAGELVCKPELPLKNVWIGTTVENQAMADKRIPILLRIPAVIKFLSCEPLLEDIKLYLENRFICQFCGSEQNAEATTCTRCHKWHSIQEYLKATKTVDWCIVGGESGKGARDCHIDWVRSLVKQCKSANVPVFVKQLGIHPVASSPYIEGVACVNYFVKLRDRKGGDISEFPEDLQIREFPDVAVK